MSELDSGVPSSRSLGSCHSSAMAPSWLATSTRSSAGAAAVAAAGGVAPPEASGGKATRRRIGLMAATLVLYEQHADAASCPYGCRVGGDHAAGPGGL